MVSIANLVHLTQSVITHLQRMLGDGLHIDTERTRHRRELTRSQNQAGHNLTVQTTIDMARTQTWTGGG